MSSSTLASVFTTAISDFWGYITAIISPTVGFIIAFAILLSVLALIFRRAHGVHR